MILISLKRSLLFGIDKDVPLAYLTSIYNLIQTYCCHQISNTHQAGLTLHAIGPPMHLSFSRSLFFLYPRLDLQFLYLQDLFSLDPPA